MKEDFHVIRVHTMQFHLYEVVKQVKLIYCRKKSKQQLPLRLWREKKGHEETCWTVENILYLDKDSCYTNVSICQKSLAYTGGVCTSMYVNFTSLKDKINYKQILNFNDIHTKMHRCKVYIQMVATYFEIYQKITEKRWRHGLICDKASVVKG